MMNNVNEDIDFADEIEWQNEEDWDNEVLAVSIHCSYGYGHKLWPIK